MIIYIYESKKDFAESKDKTVQFTYDGKRIPRKKMDEFFKEAASQLNLPENKLCYETF